MANGDALNVDNGDGWDVPREEGLQQNPLASRREPLEGQPGNTAFLGQRHGAVHAFAEGTGEEMQHEPAGHDELLEPRPGRMRLQGRHGELRAAKVRPALSRLGLLCSSAAYGGTVGVGILGERKRRGVDGLQEGPRVPPAWRHRPSPHRGRDLLFPRLFRLRRQGLAALASGGAHRASPPCRATEPGGRWPPLLALESLAHLVQGPCKLLLVALGLLELLLPLANDRHLPLQHLPRDLRAFFMLADPPLRRAPCRLHLELQNFNGSPVRLVDIHIPICLLPEQLESPAGDHLAYSAL
mmetsp:Transcript_1595/g.6971  ORF Transcript_1595/g.6971 Transcript_1595/m.6971 type:complete len:298 (+) Transcript_1595:1249-2142(+)|eukprot:scaffold1070_cov245-Pinguiococcus_pyrenoidosus.AAC.14